MNTMAFKRKDSEPKYDKFQQKAYERKGLAQRVKLDDLVVERYGLVKGNGKGADIKRNGVNRLKGLTHDFWLACTAKSGHLWVSGSDSGITGGGAIRTIMRLDEYFLDKKFDNEKAAERHAIKVITDFMAQNKSAVVDADVAGAAASHDANQAKTFNPKLGSPSDATKQAINRYAFSRGIGLDTVNLALHHGFIQHAEVHIKNEPTEKDRPVPGLAFTGRDEQGRVRSADTRLLEEIRFADGDVLKTRCSTDSLRDYAPVFPGTKDSVHICEGGFTALAIHQMHADERAADSTKPLPPTIIMTGGKDSIGWLNHDHLFQLLDQADTVTIWSENEVAKGDKTAEQRQAETDKANARLRAEIFEITGKDPSCIVIKRPEVGKDVADWNKHNRDILARQREASKPQARWQRKEAEVER